MKQTYTDRKERRGSKMKLKAPIQILDETVRYYTADISRRAQTPNSRCCIKLPDGCTCAVGRCMTKQAQALFFNSNGPLLYRTPTENKKLTTYLKPTYRGATELFWMELQLVHDHNNTVETLKASAERLRRKILAKPTNYSLRQSTNNNP